MHAFNERISVSILETKTSPQQCHAVNAVKTLHISYQAQKWVCAIPVKNSIADIV